MVEEADPRGDLPAAAAVEIDFKPDIGFRRPPLDDGRARHKHLFIPVLGGLTALPRSAWQRTG